MKVLPFTLLVPDDKSVISEQIELPHFYQYLHRHDEWQITWVEEGEGTLIAGNNMLSFRPGDVFLIGGNLPHLFKSNPEYFIGDEHKIIKACSLYFNPDGILGSLFHLPEMKTLGSFLRNNKHGFKISHLYTQDIYPRILEIHRASGTDVLLHLIMLLNQVQKMNAGIEPLCSEIYSSDISENEGIRLSNILNFIMRNYSTQIALEDISNAAYMTPQAFCRYFKKHTGHTFVSFLNGVRINDACNSLISGKDAGCISRAAYKAGFNSLTNFNRVFKSITGQSPRAYIESYNTVSRVNQMAS
ncbi:AraC family transcriptional regulator [Pedobacter lusitanus]|uniref:AraC family transcriptional regulator n=1 Tax=Pedobacter lusitanus TaxID=1503925 RepID=A0A0D0GQ66_9SPHI|nr:AraC family transcriptional regulator [Pedobacter lusitanus]KIO78310.1 AraC family transcriptional regulator [Pedobacter lusitanus]